jgi:hypothetical protein
VYDGDGRTVAINPGTQIVCCMLVLHHGFVDSTDWAEERAADGCIVGRR